MTCTSRETYYTKKAYCIDVYSKDLFYAVNLTAYYGNMIFTSKKTYYIDVYSKETGKLITLTFPAKKSHYNDVYSNVKNKKVLHGHLQQRTTKITFTVKNRENSFYCGLSEQRKLSV